MPVARSSIFVCSCVLVCVLAVGCRDEQGNCPEGTVTANPVIIPDGFSDTNLLVEVRDNVSVGDAVPVTELSAASGTIADPFARETTYSCAYDVTGPVQICVTTTYSEGDGSDGAIDQAVGAVAPKLRGPNVYLDDTLECSTTRCTEVVCPEVKNQCPEVSSFVIDPAAPAVVPEGELATITVTVEDTDGIPEPLVTTLTASHGEIADPHASMTTYSCDPDFGGVVPICVDASDGACTETVCELVRCPGEPEENACPVIRELTADPNPIQRGDETSTVTVSALDPDEFPEDLTVKWSSEGGAFEDPTAFETTFRCGEPGPVEACVQANDGDPDCLDDPDTQRCIRIECPGDVPANLCPNLNVINANPSTIPAGSDFTSVQTRGWDTDEKPFPLRLTLEAIWGRFIDTENLSCPEITPECPQSANVVFQDAIYICDRPGPVELCVEGTDGACTKTLCTQVTCPQTVPSAP